MISFENLSISRKLIWLSAISSGVALLLARVVFLTTDLVYTRAASIRNLTSQAEIVGYNSASALLFHDPESAGKTLSALKARPNIVRAGVYDNEGKEFATWKRDGENALHLPVHPTPNQKMARFREGSLEIFRPIIFDGSHVGTTYILSDLKEYKAHLLADAYITVLVLGIAFLVALLISINLSRKISDPILNLTRVAKSITGNRDYSVRVLGKSKDELGLLIETFNEMLSEIQKNQQALQKSRDELEVRVQERTVALVDMNHGMERLNNFLDSIIENIPNMVFVKDAKELRFVRFNKAGEELLGYQREDLIGKNDYDFFPKMEADFFTGKDREVLQDKKMLDIPEEPIQTKNKGPRILHTKKLPIPDEKGAPRYLLGISEDITQKKQAEDEIKSLNEALKQKAHQLEVANKELESFSYSVSHDLRAPLRAIDGFSLALLEDAADNLDAESKDHLTRIRAGSQQMAQLIDDLLNLSRLSRSQLDRQEVNLTELGQSIVKELKERDPHRNVEVHIDENLKTVGDPHLLRIALENLFSNAWKFTSKKPEALIELSEKSQKNEPKTYFIRDNGAGFDMTYVDKLFGPFQRLHASEDFAGTGIGLATVQRIITKHGGRIWAEGSVGKGATIYFTL